jgi:putative phosphoribosyl transferase
MLDVRHSTIDREVVLNLGARLPGRLVIPEGSTGLVLLAHGADNCRRSSRSLFIADQLHARRLGTLLFDLLTHREAEEPSIVFDAGFLAQRLLGAVRWLRSQPEGQGLALGYLGAGAGAAAALVAAARVPSLCRAVVSRGGRPDLAGEALAAVRAPTLLIVGGNDHEVLRLNREALARLSCEKSLLVVPGAGHLFGERRALERVVAGAAEWFAAYLAFPDPARPHVTALS